MVTRREMMLAFILMGHDQEALRQAKAMRDIQEEDQPRS